MPQICYLPSNVDNKSPVLVCNIFRTFTPKEHLLLKEDNY